MAIKKILVAIGYADGVIEVLRQAKYLAEFHRAELLLIHVIETIQLIGVPEGYGYMEIVESEEEAKAAAVTRIENLLAEAGLKGESIEQIFRVGTIKNEIIDCAKERGADLIIVGSHENLFASLHLGSQATAVLHHAESDVLVVRPELRTEKSPVCHYKKILMAVEFAPETETVIERARELTELYQAKLTMVHVVNRAPVFEMPLSLFEKEIVEKVEWQFKQLVETYQLHGVVSQLLLGSPGKEIANYAKKENYDLIIVGSHSRHGAGLLFGSTASAVFNRSSCDVLAVKV